MTDMNKVADKIQKLLALAGNNPSEEEAKAAALKAQKLIAQYNIDVNALKDAGEKIEYACLKAEHNHNSGFRGNLAATLAPNFRCKALYIGQDIWFFGRDCDAKACVSVFEYMYRIMHSKGRKLRKAQKASGGDSRGVATSYYRGFLVGLKQELDAQCVALAIVVPDDVVTEFHAKFNELGHNGKLGMKNTSFDYEAYTEGVRDGKQGMRSTKLGSGS